MPMMFVINKENFAGHRELTCYSCHRGAAKLVRIPVIRDEEKPATMAEATGAAEDESAANLPRPDEILSTSIRALSGASASGDSITAFDR
jgi:photosynthetic reaction center cytochrome c subunit